MSNVEFLDQMVIVEVHLLPNGQLEPLAFAWQGRRRAITGTGRRWQETLGEQAPEPGELREHYLVQTAGSDVFELSLNPATGEWRLLRAWLQDRAV